VAEPARSERPLCAEVSLGAREPLSATASHVEHWILVEYAGYWPRDPLDATIFAGALREHLTAQLTRLPHSKLLLVRRPGRARRERVRLFYGASLERRRRFWTLELERHPDLLELDLAAVLLDGAAPRGEPLDHPVLLVCTHGKRDRCCARYGQALCTALHKRAPAGWVWQASHVGGDRFAGNVVCVPEGLYFGRVVPKDVRTLLAAYLEGRIELERYRGRSCYPFPVQAAELDVRRRSGLTGFSDLRVLQRSRIGEGRWRVDLLADVAGDRYEVEVGVELGEEAYLTCNAAERRHPRRFVVRSCRLATA
jgi:hypothetical protein